MSGIPKKQINIFLFEAATINQFYYGIWAQPTDKRHLFRQPEFWIRLAKIAERGLLDGIFFADSATGFDTYRNSLDPAAVDGVFFPTLDPFLIASIVAASTTELGIAVTASTTDSHPFRLARTISTLDQLSNGRAGWNIVFGNTLSAARHYGREMLTPPQYYELADEVIDIMLKLWEGSWDDGAVVEDKKSRVFARPGSVHGIGHVGKHFSVGGPSFVDPSRQRVPLLCEASGTTRGVAYASRHAELLLVGAPTRQGVAELARTAQSSAAEHGRASGSLKVTAYVDIIVGRTAEEALAKAAAYDSYITFEGAMVFTESKVIYDGLPDDATIGSLIAEGCLPAGGAADGFGRDRTLGEFRSEFHFLRLPHRAIGTPEHVVDLIEQWIDEDGLDAINLRQYHVYDTLTDFVDLVVPELQRRGRFRTAYNPGETLRERVLGKGPWVADDHPATKYRGAFA
ncbi:NtaA/DmoA family FMN-dependent monooxygenase [Mycolicibacterium septicum DSM 44393]|uniref:NtaA/DmoA family FMN-dependent monooxygenase n=1 Tax=Mycolicibacterium septicum DSM 44393 TaxID=1341646 RepID=A0A7X6RVR2_9MYCO|nr:NtaA/DmoA family FMN-dependent monooxygenase [Mycolicibacterium septicum]NKZ10810.1 NtaA/DmoA family FMN-dependent monooxygenase [Mycolicibacterium septicum DSM 44393]